MHLSFNRSPFFYFSARIFIFFPRNQINFTNLTLSHLAAAIAADIAATAPPQASNLARLFSGQARNHLFPAIYLSNRILPLLFNNYIIYYFFYFILAIIYRPYYRYLSHLARHHIHNLPASQCCNRKPSIHTRYSALLLVIIPTLVAPFSILTADSAPDFSCFHSHNHRFPSAFISSWILISPSYRFVLSAAAALIADNRLCRIYPARSTNHYLRAIAPAFPAFVGRFTHKFHNIAVIITTFSTIGYSFFFAPARPGQLAHPLTNTIYRDIIANYRVVRIFPIIIIRLSNQPPPPPLIAFRPASGIFR